MPAARKTTRKVAEPVATEDVVGSDPVQTAPKKRASRKKVVENEVKAHDAANTGFVILADVPRTADVMERVKSKVEMFGRSDHLGLLKNIIERYEARLSAAGTQQNAYDEFKTQVTENQNGIFLNLTSCTNDLWQACVQCIEQLERQHNDFERLDKERQQEIEEMTSVA
jgi:hypothetical protein